MASRIPVYIDAEAEFDLNFRSVDDQPLMETSKASVASALAVIGLVTGVLVQTRYTSILGLQFLSFKLLNPASF